MYANTTVYAVYGKSVTNAPTAAFTSITRIGNQIALSAIATGDSSMTAGIRYSMTKSELPDGGTNQPAVLGDNGNWDIIITPESESAA